MAHLRAVAARPPVPVRYDLLELLGTGGMGSVWRAADRVLGRDVAVKVLAPHLAGPDFTARLMREAEVLARLEHPGIVPIHDAGPLPDGTGYYVMRLVRGQRLDQHARAVVSEGELLRLFVRVCEAVGFANDAGVVHRDLKPANVMVGRFGEVLVVDWGVAKLLGTGDTAMAGTGAGVSEQATREGLTAPGTVLGTPGYMAPEQAAGFGDRVDARADVYGLGAMLAALLRARGPVPPRLAAITRRATAADPAGRYPTAGALAVDLGRYLDGEAVAAYHESALDRAVRFAGRHRVAILLVVAYIAMRLAVLAWRGI